MIVRRMGEAYSSGDCEVTVAGIQDVDPSSIDYNYKYAHKINKGLKRGGRTWSMGPKDMDAKITLPLDIVSEFEKKATDGDIALIRPFPINVTFFNHENEMIKDFIFAKFTGNGRTVTSDGDLEKELELFVLDIKLNQ